MTDAPSLPASARSSATWRITSSLTMGFIGFLSRTFLYGLSNPEIHGLDSFLATIDARQEVGRRQRGLITVSNHVSVVDDPLIWGVLPFRYAFNPENHRWGLASHDICFQGGVSSLFFTLGQILPTHRGAYSTFGGLFQPTMTQAIRLLSAPPFAPTVTKSRADQTISDLSDPFSSSVLTYSTNGRDSFPAPSAYQNRAYSWVHIFPEGRIHQHPHKTLRYFKWGVSRLILESEPMPDIIPIFVDGSQEVMHESRTFPRFLPRIGKQIRIAFGEPVDTEQVFGDLRRRWQRLVQQQADEPHPRGEVSNGLKYSDEAMAIRAEVTDRVRREVLKVRRSLGYDDEDPKNGRVETWIEEGAGTTGRQKKDGSWVGDT